MNNEELRPSRTYKIKVHTISDHAIYFTIVGGAKPEAFFINSKEMSSFQWVTALMTSYSRQIKAGISVEEIIEDMKNTFDPNGKYMIPDGSGREAHSFVHHLGLILESHVKAS